MVKKILTLALGLVLSLSAMAQYGNPTVPQSDIQFWTGTGSNRAVIAITWNDATAGNIGIAWGVQWNGTSVTIGSLMDTIAAYDSRLTLSGSSASFISNFTYVDTELGLNLVGPSGWWWYNWKAADGTDKTYTSTGVAGDIAVNGDFVDWLPMDETTYESYPADTMIMATDPNSTPLPEDATIAASDILYWVGEGSNQVIFAVNWADTALAWGYRFSTDSVSVENVMIDIQSADPRFSFSGEGWLNDINFVETAGDTLGAITPGWWMSTLNGNSNASAGMATMLGNNDFFKWGDYTVGVTVDTVTYAMVFPMDIYPVSVPVEPLPEDATIAFSDILYWVGEGSKQVVLAVNWADTALAWGYKFSTDSVSVHTVMESIAAADPRFSFSGEDWLNDINFAVAAGDTLGAVTPGWWMSTLNGNSNASAGMATMLGNNDFFKWGDYTVGVTIDTVTYAMVFPMDIHPVSVPQTQGIDATETLSLSVYPNPAADMVTLTGINASATAMLYDMRGSIVATFVVNGETRLNLSNLAAGVYMLRVADSVVKIVKE